MRYTENYHLPQWQSEDVTTWKGQLNDAFEHLDQILYIIAHQTYATPADIVKVEETIEKLEKEIKESTDSTAGLEILVGQLNSEIKAIQEDVHKKMDEMCQLLNAYSLELHSAKADIEDLKNEVAEIGNKLVAWYFPCMDGTTLPGVKDVPNNK